MPQQQPHSQMSSQPYANYVMGFPQVSFSLELSFPLILYVICFLSTMVFAFYHSDSHVAAAPTASSRRELHASHSTVSQLYMLGDTALVVWQNHPIPPPSLHGVEGSPFPGNAPQ